MDNSLSFYSKKSISIFLWCTKKPHTLSDAQNLSFYPKYLTYDYNINDPLKLHSLLISNGYYAPIDPATTLNSYKVNQLKEILSSNGLPSTGKKAELIDRILQCIPSDVINNLNGNLQYYTLSDIGNSFLAEHYDYILLHQNSRWNISEGEYQSTKNSLKDSSFTFRDVVWKIFNQRIIEHTKQQAFWDLRTDYTNLSELSFKFDHDNSNGVFFLLSVLLCDLNCVDYLETLKLYQKKLLLKKDLLSVHFGLFCNTFLISKIKKYSSFITEELVNRVYEFTSYPLKLYTQHDFQLIISEIVSADQFDTDKWSNISQKKFMDYVAALD